MKKLSALDMVRDFTRVELRHASETKEAIQRYLKDLLPEDVAEITGMSKTLVIKLGREDPGTLLDAILWKRKQEAK